MQSLYQVVILAGGQGSELYPLCEKFPKALLPINSKALIVYQLEKLQSYGFTNVLVASTKANQSKIERFLKDQYSGSVKCEMVTIPEDKRETADTLRFISNKITKDFILIASDSISDVCFDDICEFHILQDSMLTLVLKEDKIDEENNKVINPSSTSDNHDVFILNEGEGRHKNQVVYVQPFQEVKESGLKVKKALLARHSQATIKTNLFDSHIYVCKRSVLGLLGSLDKDVQEQLESWKDDVIPFLVKNQFNKTLLRTLSHGGDKDKNVDEEEASDQTILKQLSIFAYVTKDNYIKRAYNIKDYFQANFDCIKQDKPATESFVNTFQNNNIPTIVAFDADVKVNSSNIAEGVTIAPKVQISKSIIGQNSKIADGVKISNCIIMRDAVIEQGCILQNCIVSNKAVIRADCELKDCWLSQGAVVEANTQLQNEVIIQYDN